MQCLTREIQLLEKLSNAFGPSGLEDEVVHILRKELEKCADETRGDKLGNVMFYHEGKKGYPKVMLSAHMDEVGFMTTYIEDSGFLRFDA